MHEQMQWQSQEAQSHPSRVRGLKLKELMTYEFFIVVAPFTGAWIEITAAGKKSGAAKCRTLHGCVD